MPFSFVPVEKKHTVSETDIYKSCVHMYTAFKRIELESPGCSDFEAYRGSFKTLASGTFQSNQLRSCKYTNSLTNFLSLVNGLVCEG